MARWCIVANISHNSGFSVIADNNKEFKRVWIHASIAMMVPSHANTGYSSSRR